MTAEVTEVGVRPIEQAEIRPWLDALNTGFLRKPIGSEEEAAAREALLGIDPARTLGAFDGETCVGTFRSTAREVTVPGGALLPASGITNVTVTATHRRRGLLTRMMARDLAAAKDRGEALAILIAAESPIYGRFGFGPATWSTDWLVDVPRARLDGDLRLAGGRIDLASGAEVRKAGPALHDRMRRGTPGAIDRTEAWWQRTTGELRWPGDDFTEPFHALYRDAGGRVDGLLTYSIDDRWQGMLPQNTLTVRSLIAATPQAEQALWRYALSVDWVVKIAADSRPTDDLLPLLLGEPRAARLADQADFMWARLLDVPRALQARSYAAEGELVLDVHDAAGPAGGRYALHATAEGAEVSRTTRTADLALDIARLSALYLGDGSAVRLAAAGLIEEAVPGAAARADLLLRTPRRPWCPDGF